MLEPHAEHENEEPRMVLRASEGITGLALCIAGIVPLVCVSMKFYAALNGFPLELNEGALYAGYGMGIASILGYKVKERLVVAKQKLDKAKATIEILKPIAIEKGIDIPDLTVPPKSS